MVEKIKDIWGRINRFIKEVNLEMKKVSWPPRREIAASTVVVIISVVVISFFLALADLVLQKGLEKIIR